MLHAELTRYDQMPFSLAGSYSVIGGMESNDFAVLSCINAST